MKENVLVQIIQVKRKAIMNYGHRVE